MLLHIRPLLALVAGSLLAFSTAAAERPNLLIITVDDMSADSVGAFGCEVPDTTPHIDQLARGGMKFNHAHVQVGNCMPGRNVMWSGRYSHNNWVEGFYQVHDVDYPVLLDLMREAGYFTAIRGKVSHSTPNHGYQWDAVLGPQAHNKDAPSYGASTAEGIRAARQADKPFCLMINVSDPHKPFFAQDKRTGETIADPHQPSRVFTPEEIAVPGFLFDDPVVRKELAHYYSSVRRADDCVGQVLSALGESGQEDNTLVLFLSDHGMALPFAKTQLYHHSTHTPLIVHWPGVTEAGAVDQEHMVSAVDLLPTLLDVAEAEHPDGLDGRSFEPILRGQSQQDREVIIKEYNENAGGSRDPMRAVQTKRLLYIFNPWSNGRRVMATATNGTPTYRRMRELAETDPKIAARHDLYQHRVVEELYDVQEDPDCLKNLIDDPALADKAEQLRGNLLEWMEQTGDHMLAVFRQREDPQVREAYVREKQKESDARRAKPRRGGNRRTRDDLISIEPPASLALGEEVTVRIRHALPEELGQQKLQVTLKAGEENRRLDRKVITVEGRGTAEVTFRLPDPVPGDQIRVAAFVGPSYQRHLQHLQTNALRVESR